VNESECRRILCVAEVSIVHAGDLGSDRAELVQHCALADVETPGRCALDKDLVLERQHLVHEALVLTGKELESDGLIVGHVRYSTAEQAKQCGITFVRPVRPGDRLIVHALERCRTMRTATYDCTVKNEADGKIVAEFRGHSRTIDDEMPA